MITALLCMQAGILPAQTQDRKARKAPNVSVSIGPAMYKQEKKAYFNIGLMAKVYRLQGIGINLLSSTARTRSDGLQLSGFANINGTGMRGLQLSGIANINGTDAWGLPATGIVNIIGRNSHGMLAAGGINITGENTDGMAIGGLLNIAGKASNGMAVGGLANISGENTTGAALSGLLNVSGKDVRGMQATALLNIAGREANGVQAAALSNVAVGLNGVQAGIANYASRMKGLQMGAANIAGDTVRGVQIGIVNYSRDTTGVKLGIVNLTPRTRVQMMVYGGNAAKFNVAARFLNRWSYTILGIGAPWLKMSDPFSLSASFRAGLHVSPVRNLRLSGDLGYSHIEAPGNAGPAIPKRMYALEARINAEYQVARRLGLFVSGGYASARHYRQGGEYEGKPVIEFGLLLF